MTAAVADGRAAWDTYVAGVSVLAGLIAFEELAPEDRELWARIEARAQAPLKAELEALTETNTALTARITELEQQLATLQPEGAQRG